MKTLYSGRFTKAQDRAFRAYNDSLPFDRRLLGAEIHCSKAYATALGNAGVLAASEVEAILGGLESLRLGCETDSSKLDAALAAGVEDVHAFVESELHKLIGNLAYKLHTGRSRNEQTATNLRVHTRELVDALVRKISDLIDALVAAASRDGAAIMPGYTHLQRAQPILWGHYLLSFVEMLTRDLSRLADARVRLDECPLGSGALAGNSFGLDRHALAKLAGFAMPTANSLDATSDRDFVVETLSACSLVMTHLSRLAEDLILFATQEFAFVELGEEVSTGSSLMPQKKNPDALELIRGKTGRVTGRLVSMLMLLKGLPSGYNKDLQEDKEALFEAFDTTIASVEVMRLVIATTVIRRQTMLEATQSGFLNATDLAEHLVRRGLPFRQAHELTGKLVVHALAKGCRLEDLSDAELATFSPLLDGHLRAALTPEACVRARSVKGGTAGERVQEALSQYL